MANPQSPPPSPSVSRIDWRRVAASPWTIGLAVPAACLLRSHASASSARFSVSKSSRILPARSPARPSAFCRVKPWNCSTHPPGYPFVVALGRVLSGEWLDAALWISGISAAVVLIASIATLPQACGNSCVLGRAPGMRLFNTVPGVRLHRLERHVLCCPCLLLACPGRHALAAPRRLLLWSGCGAIAACVLLTRSNGMVAAAVLALPWLVPSHEANRARNFAALAGGFLLPLVAWIAVRRQHGFPAVARRQLPEYRGCGIRWGVRRVARKSCRVTGRH